MTPRSTAKTTVMATRSENLPKAFFNITTLRATIVPSRRAGPQVPGSEIDYNFFPAKELRSNPLAHTNQQFVVTTRRVCKKAL
jgi:hypothetical protein